MIISRLFSMFLRFGEFVAGAVVLGLVAHFLRHHHKTHTGPLGREIYTEVVAGLSVVMALIWLIPFKRVFMHYPFDFIMAAAWFAAFGALVNWLGKLNCGGVFHWGGIQHGGYCGEWKAAEAFSFISACFWLASFLLDFYVFHFNHDARASRHARPQATV